MLSLSGSVTVTDKIGLTSTPVAPSAGSGSIGAYGARFGGGVPLTSINMWSTKIVSCTLLPLVWSVSTTLMNTLPERLVGNA